MIYESLQHRCADRSHRARSLVRWHDMDAEFDRGRGWAIRGVHYVDGNDHFAVLSREITQRS